MSVAPDDLPRSSSGRVPQWVVDEAAGRPSAPTAWRADVPPPVPRSRTRWVSRSVWLSVVLVLVLVGGRWAAVHPDRVSAAWEGLSAAGTGAGTAQPGAQPAGGVGLPAGADPSAVSPDGTYAFISVQTLPDGSVVPVTWSACGQVRYTVSTDGAPSAFRDQVAVVAQELSDATGLVFVDADTSTMITNVAPPVRVERTAAEGHPPVVIAFVDESSDAVLEGDVVGVASTSAWTDLSGRSYFTTGVVHLDTDLLSYGDYEGEPAYVSTLRHEMGHLLGLDHVDDAAQLMTPVEESVHTFRSGDLAGLALLGAGGCSSGL